MHPGEIAARNALGALPSEDEPGDGQSRHQKKIRPNHGHSA
jgi:hypothetical protein